MSEKMKSNLNNWLLAVVTVMIGLVSYIYITKALNTLIKEMVEMKTSNTFQHQIIVNSVDAYKEYSNEILEKQIEPNTKWRLEGEPRLSKIEHENIKIKKKVGIY